MTELEFPRVSDPSQWLEFERSREDFCAVEYMIQNFMEEDHEHNEIQPTIDSLGG
jgi:hypothetical protein